MEFSVPSSAAPNSEVVVKFTAYSSCGELEKAELYFNGVLVDSKDLFGHVYSGGLVFRIGYAGGTVKLVVRTAPESSERLRSG